MVRTYNLLLQGGGEEWFAFVTFLLQGSGERVVRISIFLL